MAQKKKKVDCATGSSREGEVGLPNPFGNHKLPSQATNVVYDASVFNASPVEFPNFNQKCLLQSL